MKIQVIEDNVAVAGLLQMLLERRGHQVDVFTDPTSCPYAAEDACKCRQGKDCPDAIIADYQLPNITGLELLLRNEKDGCRLPRANKAVVSALMSNARRSEIEAHGYTILRKPFEIARLDEFLRTCETRLKGS